MVMLRGKGFQLTSRLEGSTANQEAVNVGLLGELLAVLLADGAAVEDAGLVRGLLADVVLEPLADAGVDLLGLLLGGDLAGANGPDGLVGDDDLGPVADLLLEGSELSGDDLKGLVGLALLERLAAAPDDAHTVVGGVLGLGGHDLISLAQDGAALAVAQDGPLDVGVLELVGAGLAGEGAVGLVEDILGRNGDLLLQGLAGSKQVDGRGGNNGLCVEVKVTGVSPLSRIEARIARERRGFTNRRWGPIERCSGFGRSP